MAQNIEDLQARMAALEARMAALEAKVKPSDTCIYAGQVYGEGAVAKQGDGQCHVCIKDFNSGRYQWGNGFPCQ